MALLSSGLGSCCWRQGRFRRPWDRRWGRMGGSLRVRIWRNWWKLWSWLDGAMNWCITGRTTPSSAKRSSATQTSSNSSHRIHFSSNAASRRPSSRTSHHSPRTLQPASTSSARLHHSPPSPTSPRPRNLPVFITCNPWFCNNTPSRKNLLLFLSRTCRSFFKKWSPRGLWRGGKGLRISFRTSHLSRKSTPLARSMVRRMNSCWLLKRWLCF